MCNDNVILTVQVAQSTINANFLAQLEVGGRNSEIKMAIYSYYRVSMSYFLFKL